MQLRVGDRFVDETGEWKVVGPPYSTGGGKIVHARVQRIDQPASGEVRKLGRFLSAPTIRALSRSLLNLAERGGRASYPQFTAVWGVPT